jgi:S1-C subfamily serine protease
MMPWHMKHRRWLNVLAVLIIGWPPASLAAQETAPQDTLAKEKVADDKVARQIAATCQDAVVGVYCARDAFESYWGTGAVVSPDGFILTSTTTVPAGIEELYVHFRDYRVLKARVIEIDEALECVLLKVEAQNLPHLPVARKIPAVGEPAYSLGNAEHLIRLSGEASFSRGTVSGVYDVQSADNQSSYAGLAIETTAAINPGQDGGPLINDRGQIVGLLSLSFSESRWQGTAVPMARLLEGLKSFRAGVVRVSEEPLLPSADRDRPLVARARSLADRLVALTVERTFPAEHLTPLTWPRYRRTIDNWEDLAPAAQVAVINDVAAAEATINANRMVRRPAAPVTGVLISADGHILTSAFNVMSDTVFKPRKGDTKARRYEGNLAQMLQFNRSEYEVLENPVQSIQATLAGGKTCAAKIVARNPKLGIALLKIEEQDLPYLDLAAGRADPVLGETVGAMGIVPGQPGRFTLNEGMISAARRDQGRRFQFTALANYGNSGGLILNAEGKILGLVLEPLRAGEQLESMLRGPAFPKASGLTTGRLLPMGLSANEPSLTFWQIAPNSGVGFAAPVGRILETLPDLMRGKDVVVAGEPYLGITPRPDIETVNKDEVIVHGVAAGSPAAKAGLAAGDKVLQIDGQSVANWKALLEIVARHKVGDMLAITVARKAPPSYVEINGVPVRNERDLRKLIESLEDKQQFSGHKVQTHDSELKFEVTLGEPK